MKIIKKIYPVFFIVLLCAVIIAIWFKDGKLLATGEEGLMLVNPDRAIEIYKYSWNEVGSGGAFPGWNAILPLFYLESYIINLGFPLWIFQETLFFLLMSIGALSIYYLCKELLKSNIKDKLVIKAAFIAGIFYILNPVSLLGVWYRFLYEFMFFYALAPLFFYLYVVGVKNRSTAFVIIAPFITLLFSVFASPAPPLLLWFLPFSYSLILAFIQPSEIRVKFKIFPLVYFTLVFIFWILINFWWIFPYIEFSKASYFADKTSFIHAVNTLKANSKDFTLDNVIRLIHGGFLYKNEAFGNIYKNPIFLLFSWLIPIITVYGLLKLKTGQIKLLFTSCLILLLFLAKGTSPPLGNIFIWLFSNVGILHVFRNTLEKFGMVMPIIYAPLFGFGLSTLLNKIQGFKKRISLFILALASLTVYNWPFFTGALATFGTRDIRVEVPSSFQEANNSMLGKDHIILSIPVMGGASGFYKWEYGYKGADASPYLFNHPVINIFYDATSFSGQMLVAFSNGYLNNLVGISQLFSADIISFRKDTDVPAFGYNLDALERSKKMINQSNLQRIFDSQQVSLWTLPPELIVPVIHTPHSVRFGQSPQELISLLENNQFDPKAEAYICTSEDKCNPYLSSQDISQIQINTIPEKIEFKKVSPVNYDIKVSNNKGRFLLVFNNNFHPGWTAFVGDKPISSDRHIIANGYANGFIIDQIGSFEISLRFTPAEKIQNSYKVSVLALLFGFIVLFGLAVKTLFTRMKKV